jgi:hypothetical protein
MSKSKLCAATVIVALATATVSVSAAPPPGVEAPGEVVETPPVESAVVPALAVAGGLGLAGAFVLGFLQGYTEAKNEKKQAAQESCETGTITTFMHLGDGSIDHVLD